MCKILNSRNSCLNLESDIHSTDNMELRTEFSRRLEVLVDARGYPKTNYGRNSRLSKDLGVSEPYVYKLFHGHICAPPLLVKLVTVLRSSTDYLLGLTDDMNEPGVDSTLKEVIARSWIAYGTPADHFNVAVPAAEEARFATLRGLWAKKKTIKHQYDLELVIYDQDVTSLIDGQSYLVSLDNSLQIRTLERVEPNLARMWVPNFDVQTTVFIDSESGAEQAGSSTSTFVGRVVSRQVIKT